LSHEVDEDVNKTAHGQICKLYANSMLIQACLNLKNLGQTFHDKQTVT